MTLSDHLVRFDGAMFVGDELQLGVGFDAARAGSRTWLGAACSPQPPPKPTAEGLTAVVPVGLRGSGPGASNLVKVHFRDLVMRDDSAVLTLRWEATGPAAGCSGPGC